MADNAPIDQNDGRGLFAASSTDGKTPVKLYANASTHRLLVESTLGGVVGPGASTDGAIVLWNGTAGEEVKNSTIVPVETTTAPTTTATPVFTSYYGGNTKALGDPVAWWLVTIAGVAYKIPLYT